MLFLVVFALLAASAVAEPQFSYFSFSPPQGQGRGTQYTLSGEGRITSVRVWELYNNYIKGIQFRYGYIWSAVVGYKSGTPQEIELYDGEFIIQISGKYSYYVQSLIFVTNMGRSLIVGQPSGTSFNLYSGSKDQELTIISGRRHFGITSIGAHWSASPASKSKSKRRVREIE